MLSTILLQSTDPDQFLGYLLLAYAVMWLIAFGYIVSLAIQQRSMRQDIELLRRLVDQELEERNGE